MGYLNNNIITVDAILTKKGRETLAKNDGSFRITQFALGDDEIDYTLYNVNHPFRFCLLWSSYRWNAFIRSISFRTTNNEI